MGDGGSVWSALIASWSGLGAVAISGAGGSGRAQAVSKPQITAPVMTPTSAAAVPSGMAAGRPGLGCAAGGFTAGVGIGVPSQAEGQSGGWDSGGELVGVGCAFGG